MSLLHGRRSGAVLLAFLLAILGASPARANQCWTLNGTTWPRPSSKWHGKMDAIVKIGSVQTITGQFASYGTGNCNAFTLWAEMLEAKGGIVLLDGKRIGVEFLIDDCESNADKAGQVATDEILPWKPDIIVNPYSSSISPSVTLSAQESGTPTVAWGAASESAWVCPSSCADADDCNDKAPPCKSPNSPRFKNVMSTWGTGAAYFSTFVSTVKTAFKSKTMVVIAEPKEFPLSTSLGGVMRGLEVGVELKAEIFITTPAGHEGKPVVTETGPRSFAGAKAFTVAAASWREAGIEAISILKRQNLTDIDVVVGGTYYASCVGIAQGMVAEDWWPPHFAATACADNANIKEALGKNARFIASPSQWDKKLSGVYYTEKETDQVNHFHTSERTAPQQFYQMWVDRWGATPRYQDASAMAAAYIVEHTIRNAGLAGVQAGVSEMSKALTSVYSPSFHGLLATSAFGYNDRHDMVTYQLDVRGDLKVISPQSSAEILVQKIPPLSDTERNPRCPAGTHVHGDNRFCKKAELAAGNATLDDIWCDTSCAACTAGHYTDITGAWNCVKCPSNTVTSKTKTTACDKCPANHVHNADHTACVMCPAGTARAVDEMECTPCSPGFFLRASDAVAGTKCLSCDFDGGGWQDKSGATRCNPCTANSIRGLGSKGVSADECVCNAGYTRSADGECLKCPDGADCSKTGNSLAEMPVKRGHFRFFESSLNVYTCPEACLGSAPCACEGGGDLSSSRRRALLADAALPPANATYGQSLCAENAEGPLCMLCAKNHYRRSSFEKGTGCLSCTGQPGGPIALGLILTVIGIIFLMVAAYVIFPLALIKFIQMFQLPTKYTASVAKTWWRVGIIQCWYGFQTMVRFTSCQIVSYPSPFDILLSVTKFLSFDISLIMPSMQCLVAFNYFSSLLIWTIIPIALMAAGLLAVAVLALVRGLSSEETSKLALNTFGVIALIIVLLHNSICSIVFQFFVCDDTDYEIAPGVTTQYLVRDYSISCNDAKYKAFTGYASFMVFLYVVAFPALLLFLLYRNRRNGVDDGSLSFLTRHCKTHLWWYEVASLEFRLLVSGALMPFIHSDELRIMIIIILLIVFNAVTRDLDPMVNLGHTRLVTFLQLMILAVSLFSLVLVGGIFNDEGETLLSVITFVVSILVLVVAVYSYRAEKLNLLVFCLKARKAFTSSELATIRLGMNVKIIDQSVLNAAESILKGDEISTEDEGYLKQVLLPLHNIWCTQVPKMPMLQMFAPKVAVWLQDEASKLKEGNVKGEKAMDVLEKVLGPLYNTFTAADFEAIVPSKASTVPVSEIPKMFNSLVLGAAAGSKAAQSKGEKPATLQRFVNMATVAHHMNMGCWKEMARRAKAHLAEGADGAALAKIDSFASADTVQRFISSQPVAAFVDSLGNGALIRPIADKYVLAETLHTTALAAFPEFLSTMRAILPGAGFKGAAAGDDNAALSAVNGHWSNACHIKCSEKISVKNVNRISDKVEEYVKEGEGADKWPFASKVTDPLRASVECDTSHAMLKTYNALNSHPALQIIRLKNNLAAGKKPFNMHINALFTPTNTAPLVVEFQLVHSDVGELGARSHIYYTISRAKDIHALCAAAPECEAEDAPPPPSPRRPTLSATRSTSPRLTATMLCPQTS